MTLLWIEGFEAERGRTYNESSYAIVTNTSPEYHPGQNSAYSWQLESYTGGSWLTTKTLASHTTYVIGFRLKVEYASLSGTDQDTVGFNYGATRLVSLGIHEIDNGSFEFTGYAGTTDGGSELGGVGNCTSAPIDTGNGWNYFELKVLIDSSSGTLELRMNGTPIINVTGQNTLVGGTALLDNVLFGGKGGSSSYSIHIDDIYILNGDATAPNDFLGEQIIEAIDPSGIGSSSEWDPEESGVASSNDNWENVVKSQVHTTYGSDDSYYVATGDEDDKDLYAFGNLEQITDSITGIRVSLRARIETTGAHDVDVIFEDSVDGEGVIDTVTIDADHTLYSHFHVLTALNPSGSGTTAFTPAEINAGAFGIALNDTP